MKYYFIILLFLLTGSFGIAQELNCNVQINSDQVQGTNKAVFNTLQTAITEFLNNRRWTDLTYTANERIDCNINIIVKAVDGDAFTSEILVQSRRPVYNSNYTSPLLNIRDQKFTFTYKEFDQLEMVSGTLTSNLTAVLAYYAYLIIGYDMDSFGRLGGTPCFQQAESIVTAAQSSDWTGWKAFEDSRNRYAIINNLMDEQFKKYRNYFYDYHRLGLDEMAVNAVNGRAKIAAGIPVLRETNRSRPSAVVIGIFMDTKSDELINIFKKGTDKEKATVVEILTDVNPTQTARYETILESK